MFGMAANSILAKSRSKYGRRLTRADFRLLCSLNTVSEIAAKLKTGTHYAGCLSNVSETDIHREYLEHKLRAKIYDDFASLCRFEKNVGESLFKIILRARETSEILHAIRHLMSNSLPTFHPDIPDFFLKSSKVNFEKIVTCKTYAEICELLKQTPYYKTLAAYVSPNEQKLDYTSIELALDALFFELVFAIIKKDFKGSEKVALQNFFLVKAELQNVSIIYRTKKYYDISKSLLISKLLPYKRFISKANLQKMLDCESADEICEILSHTPYAKKLSNDSPDFIGDFTARTFYEYARHNIRFSPLPSKVLLCCVTLFEYEVQDLITVVEGVRYGLQPSEIEKLLVIRFRD
jgi:V/A-type H+-transporting ATPase subunit C